MLLQTRDRTSCSTVWSRAIEAVGARRRRLDPRDGARDRPHRSRPRSPSASLPVSATRPIRGVVLAPDRYLSGEATGIIRTLEGGPTCRATSATPAQLRSDSRPVLVNNVETMAAQMGLCRARRRIGVPRDLASHRRLRRITRVVIEIDPGTTLGEVVDQAWQSPTAARRRRCFRRVRRFLGRLEAQARPRTRSGVAASTASGSVRVSSARCRPTRCRARGVGALLYLRASPRSSAGQRVRSLCRRRETCDRPRRRQVTARRPLAWTATREVSAAALCRHPRRRPADVDVGAARLPPRRAPPPLRGRTCDASQYDVLPLGGGVGRPRSCARRAAGRPLDHLTLRVDLASATASGSARTSRPGSRDPRQLGLPGS